MIAIIKHKRTWNVNHKTRVMRSWEVMVKHQGIMGLQRLPTSLGTQSKLSRPRKERDFALPSCNWGREISLPFPGAMIFFGVLVVQISLIKNQQCADQQDNLPAVQTRQEPAKDWYARYKYGSHVMMVIRTCHTFWWWRLNMFFFLRHSGIIQEYMVLLGIGNTIRFMVAVRTGVPVGRRMPARVLVLDFMSRKGVTTKINKQTAIQRSIWWVPVVTSDQHEKGREGLGRVTVTIPRSFPRS